MILVDCAAGTIRFAETIADCAIGRVAIPAEDKREGDGGTPLGVWPVRGALLRPGSGFEPPALPWRWLRPSDGWSDDPRDPAYNCPVRHPHTFSAEQMFRDDCKYDAILVSGYNDSPVVPGRGSAIFVHLRGEGATEGCVAVSRETMHDLLRFIPLGATIAIVGGKNEDQL